MLSNIEKKLWIGFCILSTGSPLTPTAPDGPLSPLIPCTRTSAQAHTQKLFSGQSDEQPLNFPDVVKTLDDGTLTCAPACPW